MSKDAQEIYNLVKSGKLTPADLEQSLGVAANAAAAATASIQDWGVCYNSGTGQLSEYCTVVAANQSNPVIGLGMIAYKSDGSAMLAVQYTNDFTSPAVATSIGTTRYNPQSDGNTILCIVYGWTTAGNFYFSNTLAIVACQ
ncbi:MAG: hypothetical protein WBV94_25785 [Blastocatellia bacterium]